MKRNFFLKILLILFFFIFITLCLISCYPTTLKENTSTETTTAENTTSTTISVTTTTEIETVFNISITNGSGVSGLAKKTAELFKTIKYSSEKDKYNVTYITNADNYNYENTQIICKSDDSIIVKAAEDLKTILKVGIIITSNEIPKDTDIAIIIGKDYSLPNEVAADITTTGTTISETTTYLQYQLILTWENYRADGANRYFLLINSINLSDDSFKEGIKGIIKRFVEKYGNKITIEIFDDKGVLENSYKYEQTHDINASTSQEFLKEEERHWIAGYDGDLSTGFYINTLYFFPAYASIDTQLDKYLETIEFNPTTTDTTTTATTEEPTETIEKSYGDEIEALYDSQDYISQYIAPFLTAPSTIKFPNYPVWSPDYGMSFKKVASNEYIVVAYFDSQNGFGAMVRTYYRCNVIMKEDSFIVKNFKFLNN